MNRPDIFAVILAHRSCLVDGKYSAWSIRFSASMPGILCLSLPDANDLALGPTSVLTRGRTSPLRSRVSRGRVFDGPGLCDLRLCYPTTVRLLLRPISMTLGFGSLATPRLVLRPGRHPLQPRPQLLIAVVVRAGRETVTSLSASATPHRAHLSSLGARRALQWIARQPGAAVCRIVWLRAQRTMGPTCILGFSADEAERLADFLEHGQRLPCRPDPSCAADRARRYEPVIWFPHPPQLPIRSGARLKTSWARDGQSPAQPRAASLSPC